MIYRRLSTVALAVMVAIVAPPLAGCAEEEGVTTLRWATSSTGSAGYRAKAGLMAVLNREMDDYRIDVVPTSGAVATIRGYALGEYDGYYGADIAFRELAEGRGRFAGFAERVQRQPVQSFWAFTMEVGLVIRAADADRYMSWADLGDRAVFTGPAAWDVRAQLERAMATLEVGHRYRELDTGLAGSELSRGGLDAFIAYTAGEASLPPWVAEAEGATDVVVLNPSESERQRLRDAGMEVVSIDPGVFRSDVEAPVYFVPFFYGFHLGLEVPAEDVYRMLTIIERRAGDLAETDAVFAQIAADMPAMQRRGVAAAGDSVPVHPGLARYMRERGVWDEAWDGRVAEMP